jgi:hypothetical protein
LEVHYTKDQLKRFNKLLSLFNEDMINNEQLEELSVLVTDLHSTISFHKLFDQDEY